MFFQGGSNLSNQLANFCPQENYIIEKPGNVVILHLCSVA